MKVFGHPWSVNTRKVLMTFAEKGHTPELVVVALPEGEHMKAAHLARHPFAKVPVLEDGAFVLYESRAINAYLDRKLDGPSLTPADAEGAARVEQWIGVADAYLAPSADTLIVETMFRRYLGGATDQSVVERVRGGLDAPLDAMNAWLAGRPYLAGHTFTRADIHWMPYVDYIVRGGDRARIERRERVAAWWARVRERATWRAIAESGTQP